MGDMFKSKPINLVKQGICYILGLLIIAIGVNISKLSRLGITPVSSIPRACEQIWGMTLGTTTMIIYILLVVLQLIILRKKFRVINALGILVTFVFSWMVNFVGTDPNAFGHLMLGVPAPQTYVMKLIYMVVSVVVSGIGVFIYLRPNWVPMPAEGFAGALATVTGKPFGNCKTTADTTMVVVAVILQIAFLGGLNSFLSEGVVVREGTFIAAIGVGQFVKFFSKLWGKQVTEWLHKGDKEYFEAKEANK